MLLSLRHGWVRRRCLYLLGCVQRVQLVKQLCLMQAWQRQLVPGAAKRRAGVWRSC